MFSTILQVILALPKIFQMIKEALLAIQKIKDASDLKDAKEANEKRDNIELEKKLGSPSSGAPSGIDGAILRPKKKD